jgi:hypothetical protein
MNEMLGSKSEASIRGGPGLGCSNSTLRLALNLELYNDCATCLVDTLERWQNISMPQFFCYAEEQKDTEIEVGWREKFEDEKSNVSLMDFLGCT